MLLLEKRDTNIEWKKLELNLCHWIRVGSIKLNSWFSIYYIYWNEFCSVIYTLLNSTIIYIYIPELDEIVVMVTQCNEYTKSH